MNNTKNNIKATFQKDLDLIIQSYKSAETSRLSQIEKTIRTILKLDNLKEISIFNLSENKELYPEEVEQIKQLVYEGEILRATVAGMMLLRSQLGEKYGTLKPSNQQETTTTDTGVVKYTITNSNN